jgi:hypothetical protein
LSKRKNRLNAVPMTEEENHPQNPKRLEGLTLEDTIHNVGADSSTGTKDS